MTDHRAPAPGSLCYLQLPTTDLRASIDFYAAAFGWEGEEEFGSFTAPGLIGQWTTELAPAAGGAVIWLWVEGIYSTLTKVVDHGGRVRGRPQPDQGARWLVEVDDPSGNRIGVVAPMRTARPQPMLMCRDVEATSRWYQQLLGLVSDHGGPEYERLLSDGELVMQLHHATTEHHHGPVGDPAAPVGNGALVWFGEVGDFDGVVERARALDAPVVRDVHRNPPEGGGNGPGHRELWITDPEGYTVVVASPDGEDWQL
jgi:predicted enzyme related to lactoylglutathione lyase